MKSCPACLCQAGKIHTATARVHVTSREDSLSEGRNHQVDDMGSLLSSDEFRKLQLEVERLGEIIMTLGIPRNKPFF